jgi:hypothetical protein
MNLEEALNIITESLSRKIDSDKAIFDKLTQTLMAFDKRITRIEQVLNETTLALKPIPKTALKEILENYE